MASFNPNRLCALRSFKRVALAWAIVGCWGMSCRCDDEPKEPEKNDLNKLITVVDDVEITLGEDLVPLEFNKTPVLRWPNVTRNVPVGGTFIWTRDGRPEAIACIWDWKERGLWFGIQSLSTSKVVAKKGDRTFWQSEKPDLEFKKFDGTPVPADTAVKRLSQMKEFADRFRARVHLGDKNTEELRLLTTPIYRYKSGDIIDGALFAFVQGTDPEAILHLEARRQKGEAGKGDKAEVAEWQYAISRRTVLALEAMLDDKPIWSAEFTWGSPDQPFYQGRFP